MHFIQTILRGLEFFMALVIMSLIGNMIDQQYHSQGIINYIMFCAALAIFSLFFLVPAALKEEWGIHPFFPFILDLLNNLFWFCAAIALPSYLHCHSCSNHAYLISNTITKNGDHKSKRCREAQASTAFLWFGWACFLASTVITGRAVSGASLPVRRGGVRRGPAMSQV